MNKEVLVSLCIPTNGIIEWVFPVLDSIYQQGISEKRFEVIVTDNGNNEEFAKQMTLYSQTYSNLIYKKTDAFLFDNQLEALKIASGTFLKFVNHRTILRQGSLKKLLVFIEDNINDKPVIYCSNGSLCLKNRMEFYSNFDGFVRGLKHYASWTTGVGVWKEDFKRIPVSMVFNKISPHSGVLFSERKKDKYIINDEKFFYEIDSDQTKKGEYDLFKAFAIEELSITLELLRDGDISCKTFRIVKKAYKDFLCNLYFEFCIKNKPCSYDVSGFSDAMGIFFEKKEIIFGALCFIPRNWIKNIIAINNQKN